MKTLRKIAAVLLIIAALCPVLALYPAAADTGTVMWIQRDYRQGKYIDAPVELAGEITEGANDVLADDYCYSFNAENTGYYMVYFSQEYYYDLEIVKAVGKSNVESFVSIGSSAPFFDCYRTAGGEYYLFYIYEPGVYYFRVVSDKYQGEAPYDDCFIFLSYLGDLASFTFEDDPLYMESLNFFQWSDTTVNVCGIAGFTYGSYEINNIMAEIDEWAPGRRTVTMDISNGPEFTVEVNLAVPEEKPEKVILPDYFMPTVDYRYNSLCVYSVPREYGRLFSYPEQFEVCFSDGTTAEARIDCIAGGVPGYADIILDNNSRHPVDVRYYHSGNLYKCVITVDDIVLYEETATGKPAAQDEADEAADTADIEEVMWHALSGGEEGDGYRALPVRGELSVGENNVNVNDGCLSFYAEKSGYYAIVETVDPSESKNGATFDIAAVDSENKANFIFSTNGPRLSINEVNDGNGYKGIVFYIDEPGTYYFRFYDEDYIDGKYVETDIFSCSEEIRYLGDLVSASFGKDTLYIGKDIDSTWGDRSVDFRCDLSFSDGNTYSSGLLGSVDELEPGDRTISFSVSNGPSVAVNVKLAGLTEKIEKIVFPDDFTPAVTYHFEPIYNGVSSRTYSYPEYVELHFTDGSVKKVDFDSDEKWVECSSSFTLGSDNQYHYIKTEYVYMSETEVMFLVNLDGVRVDEMPVKHISPSNSDFGTYLSNAGGLLKFLRTGSLVDTLGNIGFVAGALLGLTKNYFKYLGFITEKRVESV